MTIVSSCPSLLLSASTGQDKWSKTSSNKIRVGLKRQNQFFTGLNTLILINALHKMLPVVVKFRLVAQWHQSGLKSGEASWMRVKKVSIFPGKFPKNVDFFRQYHTKTSGGSRPQD